MDANARAFIPVLSSAMGIVTDRQEITATLMRYILLNPGFISSTHEDEIVSFRVLAGKYGHDRDALCTALTDNISRVLRQYFPNDTVHALFTAEDYDTSEPGDGRYGIKFDITYTTAAGVLVPGISNGQFTVTDDGVININYHGAKSLDK